MNQKPKRIILPLNPWDTVPEQHILQNIWKKKRFNGSGLKIDWKTWTKQTATEVKLKWVKKIDYIFLINYFVTVCLNFHRMRKNILSKDRELYI